MAGGLSHRPQGFGFSREWSAPLASGVSICGVAAAIATGGAIRARPQVPVLVSSLVVIFAVVEVLVLPVIAQTFMAHEPLVAAAWMGLAVKTDGAAVAAGGITQSLIQAKAAAEGINYQPGWMLAVTATVKVFIDVFIGVWAFMLAYIWTNHINPRPGARRRGRPRSGQRFPKFILGFVVTFPIALALALGTAAGRLASCRGDRRSQCLARHLFRADLFLDRRHVGLPPTVAGRLGQTGRGLCRVAVRLRRLGRVRHILAVLRRRQTAARILKGLPHGDPDLRDEMKAPVEPLLPIEKKLIGWSLGAGIVLLVLLILINRIIPLKDRANAVFKRHRRGL